MSKKPILESFLKTLAEVKVDIQEHASFLGEISAIYYNDYSNTQEQEFKDHLNKMYKLFNEEVEKELADKTNPTVYLNTLERKVSEAKESFESAITNEEASINAHPYLVPADLISFFQRMATLQKNAINRVLEFIEDMLWDLNPNKESVGGFQMKFNLQRQEVGALFLLLESAGMLEVKQKQLEWFLETYCLYKDTIGKMEYKKMKAVSTLLSQLRKRDIDADAFAKQIVDDLSVAQIENREDK